MPADLTAQSYQPPSGFGMGEKFMVVLLAAGLVGGFLATIDHNAAADRVEYARHAVDLVWGAGLDPAELARLDSGAMFAGADRLMPLEAGGRRYVMATGLPEQACDLLVATPPPHVDGFAIQPPSAPVVPDRLPAMSSPTPSGEWGQSARCGTGEHTLLMRVSQPVFSSPVPASSR